MSNPPKGHESATALRELQDAQLRQELALQMMEAGVPVERAIEMIKEIMHRKGR